MPIPVETVLETYNHDVTSLWNARKIEDSPTEILQRTIELVEDLTTEKPIFTETKNVLLMHIGFLLGVVFHQNVPVEKFDQLLKDELKKAKLI